MLYFAVIDSAKDKPSRGYFAVTEDEEVERFGRKRYLYCSGYVYGLL